MIAFADDPTHTVSNTVYIIYLKQCCSIYYCSKFLDCYLQSIILTWIQHCFSVLSIAKYADGHVCKLWYTCTSIWYGAPDNANTSSKFVHTRYMLWWAKFSKTFARKRKDHQSISQTTEIYIK